MTVGLPKRVGIATDHGGFGLKEELIAQLRAAGHEVVDFGAHGLNPSDDYPDFVIPLAQAVATGKVERGIAICGRRCWCLSLRQQGSWHPRRSGSRPLLRPAGGRGRSHEHYLHGRPDRRTGGGLGLGGDFPGSRIQWSRAAPAPPGQSGFSGSAADLRPAGGLNRFP